jgi:DNA end-binding protein Ku
LAARSVWVGSINFGMVSIPTKLYSATDDDKINLHQYHEACGSRVKQPKWCPTCEKFLETADIIKGYETGDTYIPLTEADLKGLPLKSIKSIEVLEFVDVAQIDARCYNKTYFLKAEMPGDKAYKLLMLGMEKTGLVAVARLAYREKEHLCLIRPFDGVLMLQTLLYHEQLRQHKEFRPTEFLITDKEEELAVTLVKAMHNPQFELFNYYDEYRDALEQLITAKQRGEAIPIAEAPPEEQMDIADALLASINAVGAKA